MNEDTASEVLVATVVFTTVSRSRLDPNDVRGPHYIAEATVRSALAHAADAAGVLPTPTDSPLRTTAPVHFGGALDLGMAACAGVLSIQPTAQALLHAG